MRFEMVTVTARTDATTHQAQLAVCEDCGGHTWIAYQIEGQDGFHLQCLACTTTYCVGHACNGAGQEGGRS
jgi:hypothetical protein